MKIQFDDDKCTNLRVVLFSDMYCLDLVSTTILDTSTTCESTSSSVVGYEQSVELTCVVGGPQIYTESVVLGTYSESDSSCSGQPQSFDAITANYCLNVATNSSADDVYYDDYSRQFNSEYITCGSGSVSAILYANPDECAVSSAYPLDTSESTDFSCVMSGADDNFAYYTDSYPTYRKVSCSGGSSSGTEALSGGAIAGVVIGSIAGIAIIGAIVFLFVLRGGTMFAGSAVGGSAATGSAPTVQTAQSVNPMNKYGDIQMENTKVASSIGDDNL